MRGLKGKSALIIGGASGIGRAVVMALLREGVRVACVDPDVKALQTLPPEVTCFPFEGQRVSDMTMVSSSLMTRWGVLDFFVFSAARFIMRGLQASRNDWQEIFESNVLACAVSVSAMLPLWHQGGAIVHVASISAHIAQPGLTTYHATKGALLALTRSQALELAPLGIRVNSVSPSTVWTKQTESYFRSLGLSRESAEQGPFGQNMLKRFAEPEEIVRPILFLLSEEASFITGADLLVDGGYTAL
jgi:NAD(P)-dependent dehydrogenase (short-subunit alcohol dehydrogenase family)